MDELSLTRIASPGVAAHGGALQQQQQQQNQLQQQQQQQQSPVLNIWQQMNYTPPRGPCAHKPSLLAPTCACLRFMIHPLKAASSFECDGCGHHASFHLMENKAEDEILAMRKAQELAERMEGNEGRRKRRRTAGS